MVGEGIIGEGTWTGDKLRVNYGASGYLWHTHSRSSTNEHIVIIINIIITIINIIIILSNTHAQSVLVIIVAILDRNTEHTILSRHSGDDHAPLMEPGVLVLSNTQRSAHLFISVPIFHHAHSIHSFLPLTFLNPIESQTSGLLIWNKGCGKMLNRLSFSPFNFYISHPLSPQIPQETLFLFPQTK